MICTIPCINIYTETSYLRGKSRGLEDIVRTRIEKFDFKSLTLKSNLSGLKVGSYTSIWVYTSPVTCDEM